MPPNVPPGCPLAEPRASPGATPCMCLWPLGPCPAILLAHPCADPPPPLFGIRHDMPAAPIPSPYPPPPPPLPWDVPLPQSLHPLCSPAQGPHAWLSPLPSLSLSDRRVMVVKCRASPALSRHGAGHLRIACPGCVRLCHWGGGGHPSPPLLPPSQSPPSTCWSAPWRPAPPPPPTPSRSPRPPRWLRGSGREPLQRGGACCTPQRTPGDVLVSPHPSSPVCIARPRPPQSRPNPS
jgi:hypothetical protein